MSNSKPSDIFQAGDLLNNTYRIEDILGRGGTSEVYKARSEISKRVVALKALRAEFSMNDDYLALMTREETIREIRHEAIVRYYDTQRMPDGRVYLVMDYVEGPGLDKKLKSGGMSAEDLLTVAQRVAEGLNAAHKKKIVHRDLSPDNIILRDGNASEAVIIDFGIAKDSNPGAETIVGNEFAGKYAYAAPEQLSGDTDARSDIYSLGALLLSTFRGEPPDMGSNPMDVVNKKGQPLDTDGVPEPLKSLIDKMTMPKREDRFQTCEELLFKIDPDFEKTVVYTIPPETKDQEISKNSTPLKKPRSGGLIPASILSILVIGAVGAYFSGIFDSFIGPKYPKAIPYTFSATESVDGIIDANGFIQSESELAKLTNQIKLTNGTANLVLASGDIPKDWSEDIRVLLSYLTELDEFQLDVSDNSVSINGTTSNKSINDKLAKLFSDNLVFPNFDISFDIYIGRRQLPTFEVQAVLAKFEDCGPLTLLNSPGNYYLPNHKITIAGRLTSKEMRRNLLNSISEIAGERNISIQTEILNESLCLIDETLTNIPSGKFDVVFGFGSNGSPNPGGRYFVGDNPTIDVVIPKEISNGYLYVSILDVTGAVFHLLPNMNRANNRISNLKQSSPDGKSIRVAYSLKEAKDRSKPAFLIDDSTLGQSKIIVIYSDQPLFDKMRPSMESIGGYVSSLTNLDHPIKALDSRILITAKPNS